MHVHPPPCTQFISIPLKRAEPEPFKATAYFGFGRSLYFHRVVALGTYEAELWLIVLFIPVLPIAIWILCPKKMTTEEASGVTWEIYESHLIDSRTITLGRLPGILGRAWTRIAVVLGPIAGCYLYLIRADEGRPSGIKTILALIAFGWALALCLRWASRRDRIYKSIE
jgi:hypothetical protein